MIPKGHRKNFEALKRAFANGDVMVAECTDAKTGKPVITLCMVNRHRNGDIEAVPVAKFFDGNPYEELAPPEIELSAS